MSHEVFVDASFVIALINRRDQFHEKAVALSTAYAAARFVTTDCVLIEAANALAARHKAAACELLDSFQSASDTQVVGLTPELFERGLRLYRRFLDKEWGLTDCISFVTMRDMGIAEVLGSDRHFAQAGFDVLLH